MRHLYLHRKILIVNVDDNFVRLRVSSPTSVRLRVSSPTSVRLRVSSPTSVRLRVSSPTSATFFNKTLHVLKKHRYCLVSKILCFANKNETGFGTFNC